MKSGFYSHSPASGRRLAMLRPLGPSGRAARFREVGEPTKEAAEAAVAIEEEAVALNKTARSKAEGPKIHIGFRLAADVVGSLKASGPGYNARVEQALRAAGFGASEKKRRA